MYHDNMFILSPPLTIMNSTVTAVESFRFLGTTISQDLKWDNHVDSIVKKAQQRMFFLHQLKKFNLPPAHMTQFYSAVIESVLCSSINVWFGSASKSDIRRLQRTVRTADRIIGVHLPSLQDFTTPEWRNGQLTSSQTPLTPDTTCLHFSPQADTTDLCALEHLGIQTVFFPMPSPA